jgi:uncharacterized protein YbjT (DUF2867 family)
MTKSPTGRAAAGSGTISKTAVFGATGNVGSLVTAALLDNGVEVRAVVRDRARARAILGDNPRLELVQNPLQDAAAFGAAFAGADTAFVAMGSIGDQGEMQRRIMAASATAGLRQLVRLSVLNASHRSLGINQRGHASIDDAAAAAGVPYSSVRPAIWFDALLLAAPSIRSTSRWVGVAVDGRVGLLDHRDAADAAAAVLLDESSWGASYDLTGPRLWNWPEAARVIAEEAGRDVRYNAITPEELTAQLERSGVTPGQAALLVAREQALQAGENNRLTGTFTDLTGREPRTLEAFVRENRSVFL